VVNRYQITGIMAVTFLRREVREFIVGIGVVFLFAVRVVTSRSWTGGGGDGGGEGGPDVHGRGLWRR
jgi:hypothetical protein